MLGCILQSARAQVRNSRQPSGLGVHDPEGPVFMALQSPISLTQRVHYRRLGRGKGAYSSGLSNHPHSSVVHLHCWSLLSGLCTCEPRHVCVVTDHAWMQTLPWVHRCCVLNLYTLPPPSPHPAPTQTPKPNSRHQASNSKLQTVITTTKISNHYPHRLITATKQQT